MEVIRFRMEQRGEGQSGLARPLGSTPRARDVLNRKRSLTLEMVWRLNRDWHIPAEQLVAL